jgi:hypothetical protein
LINQKYHTLLNSIIIGVLSWLLYILFLILVQYSPMYNSFGTMVIAFSSPKMWLGLGVVQVACAMIDLFTLSFQMFFTNNITARLRILVKERGHLDNPVDLPDDINKCLKLYEQYAEGEKKDIPSNNDNQVKIIGHSEYGRVPVANVRDLEKIDNIHIEVASNKDKSDRDRVVN